MNFLHFNIKHLRKEQGLTQRELCAHIGVSRQAYAAWEEGRSQPRIEHIYLLCKRFQVSADYLLFHDLTKQ